MAIKDLVAYCKEKSICEKLVRAPYTTPISIKLRNFVLHEPQRIVGRETGLEIFQDVPFDLAEVSSSMPILIITEKDVYACELVSTTRSFRYAQSNLEDFYKFSKGTFSVLPIRTVVKPRSAKCPGVQNVPPKLSDLLIPR